MRALDAFMTPLRGFARLGAGQPDDQANGSRNMPVPTMGYFHSSVMSASAPGSSTSLCKAPAMSAIALYQPLASDPGSCLPIAVGACLGRAVLGAAPGAAAAGSASDGKFGLLLGVVGRTTESALHLGQIRLRVPRLLAMAFSSSSASDHGLGLARDSGASVYAEPSMTSSSAEQGQGVEWALCDGVDGAAEALQLPVEKVEEPLASTVELLELMQPWSSRPPSSPHRSSHSSLSSKPSAAERMRRPLTDSPEHLRPRGRVPTPAPWPHVSAAGVKLFCHSVGEEVGGGGMKLLEAEPCPTGPSKWGCEASSQVAVGRCSP